MIPYRLNPLGIRVNEVIPLTLTAQQAGSTVKLTATGSPTVSGLHYRLGKSGTWLAYTIGNTITLSNVGDSVQFWNSAETLSSSTSAYVQFSGTGLFSCRGNLQSMLNYINSAPDYCFAYLFRYFPMANTPEMPAETLREYAYTSLYRDNPYLTLTEDLPAVLVPNYAYGNMYAGSGVIMPPKIKATQYLVGSLAGMFSGCTGLLEAPKLLPTMISNSCLLLAFNNCSNMTKIEVNFTSWGTGDPTSNWVSGVAASGTFIKPSALPEEYGVDKIPSGWTVVNK